MGLAVSTLTAAEQERFQEISALLDADETECLDKLLATVSKKSVAEQNTTAKAKAAIASWIKANVFSSTRSFCDLLEAQIREKRGG